MTETGYDIIRNENVIKIRKGGGSGGCGWKVHQSFSSRGVVSLERNDGSGSNEMNVYV